jgi:hypothetical protein
MFGTYKDTTEFAKRCGFPRGAEERLVEMLTFKDVYRKKAVQLSAPTDDLAPLDRR